MEPKKDQYIFSKKEPSEWELFKSACEYLIYWFVIPVAVMSIVVALVYAL